MNDGVIGKDDGMGEKENMLREGGGREGREGGREEGREGGREGLYSRNYR